MDAMWLGIILMAIAAYQAAVGAVENAIIVGIIGAGFFGFNIMRSLKRGYGNRRDYRGMRGQS